MVCAYLRLS